MFRYFVRLFVYPGPSNVFLPYSKCILLRRARQRKEGFINSTAPESAPGHQHAEFGKELQCESGENQVFACACTPELLSARQSGQALAVSLLQATTI